MLKNDAVNTVSEIVTPKGPEQASVGSENVLPPELL